MMKILTQAIVIIYTLCENLNAITKGHLCVVFNAIKYIVSNYVITLQIIGVNNFFT